MLLITGATGFLGAHLLCRIAKTGVAVRALRRASSDITFVRRLAHHYALTEEQWQNIEWAEGDIRDYFLLEDALEGISQVYHCAGMISYDPSQKRKLIEMNVKGTANVVDACLYRRIEKLCYVSSIAALGHAQPEEVYDETRTWKNDPVNSWYSISKYGGEKEIWRGVEEGLKAVVVNPSVILGYADWNTSSGQFFPLIHKGFRYYPKGTTGFVDVEDVAEIMIRLMNSDISGERFIVSAENLSFRRFLEMMALALQVKPPSQQITLVIGRLASSFEKVKSFLLNTEQRYSMESYRNSSAICTYSNEKVRKALDYTFTPVEEVIGKTAEAFLQERNIT